MERAVLLCADDEITSDHLPAEKMRATAAPVPIAPPPGEPPRARRDTAERRPPAPPPDDDAALDFTRDKRERERREIIAALKACEGNQSKAATMLGISRRTVSTELDVHNLPRPRKR